MIHPHRPAAPFRFPLLTLALLPALLPAQEPAGKALPADRQAGAATVDVEQCKRWLGTLAGPGFEGRGTGQPGFQKAADFVATHFKDLGLEARGEGGSYFQDVPWTATSVVADKSGVVFEKGGKEVLRIPADRLAGTVTSEVAASGDAVLLVLRAANTPADGGADGGARGRGLPSFEGLDDAPLEGKVVLAYLAATGDDRGTLQFAARRALQGRKAAAVLFVGEAATKGGLRGRSGVAARSGNRAASGRSRAPLDASFGGDDFTALLSAAGIDPKALDRAQVCNKLALHAEVTVVTKEGPAPAMNVFAVLPGSDPKLRSEYVVIGSHLDHLGTRGDVWYPGADDDGSGTTGVLAVSRMFAKNGARPKRSVLFVCFSGEESGLIGSGWFAKNCPIPLSSIVAELQMDMIGRDEEEANDGFRRVNKGETAEQNRNSLHLVGTRRLAPALHALCLQKNETAGFDLEYDQEDMFERSDHANFAEKGVPIAFFFTGLHRDYHQPTDTPDKIHYEKLLRVATYVYDLGFELADQKGRPEIDPELWQKFRKEQRGSLPEKPAAPLGKP